MNQTQLYRLVDRAVSGCLAEILLQYRDLRLTPGRMALRLAAEHQVEVSAPTIKKWVDALPRPSGERATSAAQTVRAAQTAKAARNVQPAQAAQAEQAAQKPGVHVAVAS